MGQNEKVEHVLQIKQQYENQLMARANVVGVGVGFKVIDHRETDILSVVVNVTQKVPVAELASRDVVPVELEDVPTDVQEVGTIRAL
jgi:hypothetical protein